MCGNRRPSGHQNDILRYTTKELLSLTNHYANCKEAADSLPVSGGREAVSGSSKAVQSNATLQDAKGGKKR
jgi:hypothetical protein